MMFSGLSVSCVSAVVGALGRGVGIEQLADGGEDGVEGSRRRFAQQMLELGEACSIGFRSGEYLGRKNSFAPAERMAWRTALPLWLPRLSMITRSPGLSVGASAFST
jgi:hypothetical protein